MEFSENDNEITTSSLRPITGILPYLHWAPGGKKSIGSPSRQSVMEWPQITKGKP